ncbi:hypothetical protein TNCV_4792391 [Trichonephila clavipes]|nr:hypothetical protein TNCV_4792391 [Trichonephila clavipes]
MDAMRLSIRLRGILFHSSRSAISKSRTVAGGLGRAAASSSEHVPNMLDWIQVRRARWPFHTLYCFSFKHVLHRTSSMRSGIIILENKGISNGYSVSRDDIRSEVSRLHTFGPSRVPFRMICRSVRPPMLIPPHTIQPALLYCDLSRTNAGLFQVPLSLHTRARRVSLSRLKWDSSVNST